MVSATHTHFFLKEKSLIKYQCSRPKCYSKARVGRQAQWQSEFMSCREKDAVLPFRKSLKEKLRKGAPNPESPAGSSHQDGKDLRDVWINALRSFSASGKRIRGPSPIATIARTRNTVTSNRDFTYKKNTPSNEKQDPNFASLMNRSKERQHELMTQGKKSRSPQTSATQPQA